MLYYVIYHVPGSKVGCTSDFPQRCYNQGLCDGDFEVLTIIPKQCGAEFAGNIEHGLATRFGYKKYIHYAKAITHRSKGGKKGGKISYTSQIERGTHASQIGKTPFHDVDVQKRGLAAAAKKRRLYGHPESALSAFRSGAAGRIGGRNVQLQRLANGTHVTTIRYACPICGREGKVPGISRHVKRCARLAGKSKLDFRPVRL